MLVWIVSKLVLEMVGRCTTYPLFLYLCTRMRDNRGRGVALTVVQGMQFSRSLVHVKSGREIFLCKQHLIIDIMRVKRCSMPCALLVASMSKRSDKLVFRNTLYKSKSNQLFSFLVKFNWRHGLYE